ncbi:MAG: hypothetical protein AB1Z23_01055 [Eubacteriales bacterium]
MNRLDNDLKNAILKNTVSEKNAKDEIWENIQCELEGNNMKNTKKGGSKFAVAALSFILILLVLAVFTPTGRAAVSKIMDLFEPEKTVDTTVEGEVETTGQQLQVGNTVSPEPDTTPQKQLMTYVLYVDSERYSFETIDGVDTIVPINYPADYPEVSMKIEQITDKSKEEISSEIVNQLKSELDTVSEPYQVSEPVDGVCIDAYDGDPNGTKETMPQWNSKVVKYYLVDNTAGGAFMIKITLFVEAQEGHGARFDAMLNEFVVVPQD